MFKVFFKIICIKYITRYHDSSCPRVDFSLISRNKDNISGKESPICNFKNGTSAPNIDEIGLILIVRKVS